VTLKPGFRTTEFLLAVLTAVGTTAASLAGVLSPRWAAVASAVATFAYSLSRGIAKAGAGGGA
jgi:hypothetical protein